MSRSFFLPVHWVFSIKTGRDCFSPYYYPFSKALLQPLYIHKRRRQFQRNEWQNAQEGKRNATYAFAILSKA